ncbi:NAD(P)-binding domain-containing protein [Mesorhizobium sp. BAC0120]|uniref:NAD(P)-binding domain-containing protein n=1 Tax=Mesorhizobium sp. BAC0120 TaxID=3090670 RepID=UPI00298BCDAF|nr:NAD(P)-binding domain-containing protein [Mesorhizobium sp. BAC0120]MDW6021579.1 NAD(P)-binding domain-containing protein [Mesorhizobium sp. BAC0120]
MEESSVDVAVIGAGPYGLSIAANVTATGRTVRIFGQPLQTWANAMPLGMKLKSDGFASNLSAPAPGLTLAEFCRHEGIPYHDTKQPVSLDTFVAYGLEFQRRFVPYLETVDVRSIERSGGGFRLTTDDDSTLLARNVVLAVGVTHFRIVPRELAGLPASLVSHSAEHHRVDKFAGRDVAIVGAGASAVDLAAALIDVGAAPTIVTRADRIRFNAEPGQPSLLRRLMNPASPLGPGWRSRLASDLPQLYRQLPDRLRLDILHRHLGPQSVWYLREKVLGRADILTDHHVEEAALAGHRVRLKLRDASGSSKSLDVDHVIAATGYWPQTERLHFLDKSLRGAIRHAAGVPILSRNFETSVAGLYATGLAAAGSFGPLMRFVAGADYAAQRLGRHFSQAQGSQDAIVPGSRVPQAI